MQIQTLEEKTGLDRATIRFYEKEGLIFPTRLQNGYRDYSEVQLLDLMRIKLLRQIGLSLETIKQLMDGRQELSYVLNSQLDVIDKYEEDLVYARALCKMMLRDNATYQSIDPFRYLNVKETVAIESPRIIDVSKREVRYTEAHPFRRYFARYLDQLFLTSVLLLIVVVFIRIRPFTDMHNSFLSVFAICLSIPINAICLRLFGTTPGKFAFGIFVRDIDDKNLTFSDAIKREWNVLRFGSGFFIPIYGIIRLFMSFRTHTKGLELSWDYNSNVQYEHWNGKRLASVFLLTIVSTIFVFISVHNMQMPKFRTDMLTLEQYASNYNDYASQNKMYTYLSPEGEWYVNDISGEVIIELDPSVENWNFVTDQAECLESIEYELFTDSRFFFLDQREISLAIFTAVLSKPDAKLSDAMAATNELSQIEYLMDNKVFEGDFEYGGVVVKWESHRIEYTSHRYRLFVNISL